MSNKCQMVVFSNRAYNAIIRESFEKDPVETGGILLGHILDNGVWIVMEVLPPGIKCIFERAYFEYDDAFVNYLAQSVANQYEIPLELLGLWHRHPGSMDVFSSTDDGTNTTFALQNPSGVISGLVNIDPQFRLTMYHMDNPGEVMRQYARPIYERVEVEVGDDIIPEEYFKLRYYDGEGSNLNPFVDRSHTRTTRSVRTEGVGRGIPNEDENQDDKINIEPQYEIPLWMRDLVKMWEILKRHKIMSLIILILLITSVFSFKTAIKGCKSGYEKVVSWFYKSSKKVPHSICILGNEVKLEVEENISPLVPDVNIDKENHNCDIIDTTTNVEICKQDVDVEQIQQTDDVSEDDIIIKIESYKNTGEGQISIKDKNYCVSLSKPDGIDRNLISFTSEDTSVATVTNEGKVTPISKGKTKIIVSYNGKEKDTLLLTVKK